MTLNDIFKRAVILCGMSEARLSQNDNGSLRSRALSAVNTTLYDLCGLPPAEGFSSPAEIDGDTADAAVYGTAMFLSLALGDTSRSALFSKIYTLKRTAVKSHKTRITDALPKEGEAL